MSSSEKEALFEGWATIQYPESPHIFISGKSYMHDSLEPCLSRQPVPGMAVFEMFDVFRKRPLSDDGSWYGERFSITEISRVLLVFWRHAAIIRYYELWGAFTIDSFVRACQGTTRLRQWTERVTRGTTNREDRLQLKRQPSGRWDIVAHTAYPHIQRWSVQAIDAARRFAWSNSKKERN